MAYNYICQDMRILLLSDSHYKSIYMFDLESYDLVIHTGDIYKNDYDLIKLEHNLHYVTGNCDYFSDDNLDESFSFNDINIYITHSHKYHTKDGINNLVNATKDKYDLVCYGHTHDPKCIKEGNTIYINPGSLMEGAYAEIIDGTLYMYQKANIFSKKDKYKLVKKVKNLFSK